MERLYTFIRNITCRLLNRSSIRISSFFFILLVSGPLVCYSEEVQTEISSDTLNYQKEEGIYFLKGNVRISKGDVIVLADEAEYYEKQATAVLNGRVKYEDKDAIITSDAAEINIDAKTGTIRNGYVFLKKDNYHVHAAEIEKTGDKSYILTGARFTTCDAPVAAWCFSASKADILVGDRLKAGNVVFKIKKIPVLYTPYLWAPILTERTTGLLFPDFGYKSDLGAFYGQPLFVVLSENRDATITVDYYSERGLGQGLEYRYIERGGIAGKWWGYHIRDRELEKDFYALKSSHAQYGDEGFSHFLSLNLVNEKEFLQEYSSDIENRASRFLESSGSFSYSSRSARYYVTGQYWQDLKFSTEDVSQKLPSAGVTLNPVSIGPMLFSANAETTNFHSTDSHRIQRYSIEPRVSYGTGDTFHLHQTLKLLGSWYNIGHSEVYPSDTERWLVNYDIGVSSSIFKKYSDFTHSIEPEITYNYVTDTDYDAPLLDSQEAEADSSDLIVSIDNNLVNRQGLFFSFRLSQAYDLRKTFHPLKPLEADLSLETPLYLKFEAWYDHYLKGINVLNGEAGLSLKEFKISASQRYDRENDIQYYIGKLGFKVLRNLALNNSISYDEDLREVRYIKTSASYASQCWGTTITYNKYPDDYSIMVVFTLKGLGYFGLGSAAGVGTI